MRQSWQRHIFRDGILPSRIENKTVSVWSGHKGLESPAKIKLKVCSILQWKGKSQSKLNEDMLLDIFLLNFLTRSLSRNFAWSFVFKL